MFKKILCIVLFSINSFASSSNRDLEFSTSCNDVSEIVVVSFVGDVLVHDILYQAVFKGSQDFSQIWRKTNFLIQKADFSVANLEGPAALGIDGQGRDHGDVGFIYDRVIYSGTNFSFNYHPRILQDLKNSGYDLLSLANNHALDRKSIGIDKTLEAATEENILMCGVRHSQERNSSFHRIVSVAGFNLAFISCTEMTNGHGDPYDQVLSCYGNPNRVEQLIKTLREDSNIDAIIVLPHWGTEYKPLPDSYQIKYGRRYLEAGAMVVVGSHPHVLQPWEKYITQDGRETLLVYSLGNFVAGQSGVERKTGAVAFLGLAKGKNFSQTRILAVRYSPTYRDNTEIYPSDQKSYPEALPIAAQNFGLRNRLAPSDNVREKMCRTD